MPVPKPDVAVAIRMSGARDGGDSAIWVDASDRSGAESSVGIWIGNGEPVKW